MGIRHFFAGWRELRFPAGDRAAVFDAMFRAGIGLRRETRRGERIVCRIAERDARAASLLLAALGTDFIMGEPRGMPAVLAFCRGRPAIPLGLLLTAGWLWFSGGLVWDVRVEGNTKTPTETILTKLEELGFGVGTRFRGVDFDQLHADYAAVQNDIAWLSVYMDGTVARVQVRELWADGTAPDRDGIGANVAARESGVIEEINVFEGEALLRPGDFVRPGQVVISGVIEKKDGGFRWEYAAGEVRAAVTVPLSVEIPLTRTEMRPTGEEFVSRTIKIFKKTINLSGNYGFDGGSYDTIDTIGQLRLPDGTPLPVTWKRSVTRMLAPVTVTLSADDAAAEAMRDMRRQIREATENGILIEKSCRASLEGGVYRLEGSLTVLREIGETLEFGVTPPGGDGEQ